jgi:hypothetical protein
MRFPMLLAWLVVAVATDARAEPRAPTAPSRLSLVQAQCAGPPPGPCAPGFAFSRGTATLTSARQPAPTRDPARQKAGDVRLQGLTRDGAPFTGTLAAEVTFRTTFTTDADADCDLRGVQIEVLSLSGAVPCRGGRCAGTLRPIGPLPLRCADVAITSQLVSIVVRDDQGRVVAVPGVGVPAGKADGL